MVCNRYLEAGLTELLTKDFVIDDVIFHQEDCDYLRCGGAYLDNFLGACC